MFRNTEPVVRATTMVHPYEPCFELSEVNKVLPSKVGLRRVQTIKVVRDDEVWECVRDMGPAEQFQAEPFAFPGAADLGNGKWDVVETVERLLDAANEWRTHYAKPTPRNEPPLDLVKGFEETAIRRREASKGIRHFAMNGSKSW